MFLSRGDSLHARAVTASCERKTQRSQHFIATHVADPLHCIVAVCPKLRLSLDFYGSRDLIFAIFERWRLKIL